MSTIKPVLNRLRMLLSAVALAVVITGLPRPSLATATQNQAANRQSLAERLLDATHKRATWVAEGAGKHVVYVYFDPNCPYCHKLYLELQPYVRKGGYDVRWVPVGILMGSSHGKAAAILEAKDPSAALRRNEQNFRRHGGFGGISEDLLSSTRTDKALATNHKILATTGTEEVPEMVFRARNGGAAYIVGAPSSKELAKILQAVQ
jgi:thiol:disulfide interchange protein DsbG